MIYFLSFCHTWLFYEVVCYSRPCLQFLPIDDIFGISIQRILMVCDLYFKTRYLNDTIFIGNEMSTTLTIIRQPFKFPIRLHDLLKQNLTTTAKYTDKKQTQTLWVKNTKNILTIKLKHVIHRDNEKRWQNSKTMNKLIFVFSYLLYLRYVSTEQLCFLYVGNCLQTNCLCRIRKRWKNL